MQVAEELKEKNVAWAGEHQDLRRKHAHSIALLKNYNRSLIARKRKSSEKQKEAFALQLQQRQKELGQYRQAILRQRDRLTAVSKEWHEQKLEQSNLNVKAEQEMASQLHAAKLLVMSTNHERNLELKSQLAREKRMHATKTWMLMRARDRLSREAEMAESAIHEQNSELKSQLAREKRMHTNKTWFLKRATDQLSRVRSPLSVLSRMVERWRQQALWRAMWRWKQAVEYARFSVARSSDIASERRRSAVLCLLQNKKWNKSQKQTTDISPQGTPIFKKYM